MEGCFMFQWGGGLFFRWGNSFLSAGYPMGSIGFDGEGFEKNCWMGGHPPPRSSPTVVNPEPPSGFSSWGDQDVPQSEGTGMRCLGGGFSLQAKNFERSISVG